MNKKVVKKILLLLGLWRIVRIFRRRLFARSYYIKQLKFINTWCFRDTEDYNFYYDLEDLNLCHLKNLISNITGTEIAQVERLIKELRDNSELKEHIKKGILESNYQKDITVEFGRRIGWYVIARINKPKLVVETGVDHGVGACVLTTALMLNSQEGFEGRYIGTDCLTSAPMGQIRGIA
jgi:hypothetical protein